MTTEYQPGTVAVATVRGVEGVRVFRRHSPDTGVCDWAYNPDPSRGLHYSCDSDAADVVADIRPLVVLDPDDTDALCKALAEAMYAAGDKASAANGVHPATMRIALNSLTKPPRIPEPGLWGVVTADGHGLDDVHWVRQENGRWVATAFGRWADWDKLIDPALVREGVES